MITVYLHRDDDPRPFIVRGFRTLREARQFIADTLREARTRERAGTYWRADDVRIEMCAVPLAHAFAVTLREEIGIDACREVDCVNALRADNSCASHDHCDANMTMLRAWRALYGREPFDPVRADAAWSTAKRRGFASC